MYCTCKCKILSKHVTPLFFRNRGWCDKYIPSACAMRSTCIAHANANFCANMSPPSFFGLRKLRPQKRGAQLVNIEVGAISILHLHVQCIRHVLRMQMQTFVQTCHPLPYYKTKPTTCYENMLLSLQIAPMGYERLVMQRFPHPLFLTGIIARTPFLTKHVMKKNCITSSVSNFN